METITGRLTCFVHARATSTLAVMARTRSCAPSPPPTALPMGQGHGAACLLCCVQGNPNITTVTANSLTNAGAVQISYTYLVRAAAVVGRWCAVAVGRP